MAIGTAAAIVGGALISGAASSKASKRATKAQGEASGASIAEQRRQFDITQKNLQPFQEAGTAAIGSQQDLLGLNGPEAQAAAFAAMENSPGQQFLRDRAQKNLLRNSSAIGGLGGGNVRSALVEQGVGFAQQDMQNQFGRLGQLAGQGQSAATSIGQFGQQTAGNIGNSLMSAGNARASGIMNQNQALQQTIQGVTTGLGQFATQAPAQQQAVAPPPTSNIGII
tara:strand:+ start:654 stop:1328 length:675 start_codon:yes stop_codon:yes gene_type:complete